jgi:hypothetical protein
MKLRRADWKCARLRIRTLVLVALSVAGLVSVATAKDVQPNVSGLRQLDSMVLAQAEDSPTRAAGRCELSGCGREVCADEHVMTPCIWQPEFECYKTALCEVQSDGKCGWTMTAELEGCLTKYRSSNRGAVPPSN